MTYMKQFRLDRIRREFYRVRLGRFQFMLDSLPLDMVGIRYMFLRGMTIKGFIALEAFHNIEIGLILFRITINITDKRATKHDPLH